ncbi:hypothetical protein CHCC15325_1611 [Bacillus licheniformis]|jgi:hypothetical protein|nr:hypothetical protein B4092_0076 [Bacillus licheniformis]TWN08521.1 hypothetical protein CHCC14564_2964 [Bacillus licheniformis LMG 17339]TWJ47749.1 hypothetical protein CHCC5025_1072 [Bacillus licheniformis]TWJ61891.1 hypothetical protein CHCC5020_3937 [Bacillus licheniformis]TWJ83572.1 hypothetical protein CHCC20496_1500 [Bacillus licheniformis]
MFTQGHRAFKRAALHDKQKAADIVGSLLFQLEPIQIGKEACLSISLRY